MTEPDKPSAKEEKAAAAATAAAKTNGCAILNFFQATTTADAARQAREGARETRGRKAAAVETAATAPPSSPAIDKGEDPRKEPAAAGAAIQKRTNWSTGENLARITAAVTEWKSGSGRAAPREFLGETEARKPTMAEFAMLVEIPKGTLGSYSATSKGKARVTADLSPTISVVLIAATMECRNERQWT